MLDIVLSIVMLAAIALGAGAIYLWRKGVTKQASLMAILAFVMLINIAIWVVPMDGGDTPGERAAAAE